MLHVLPDRTADAAENMALDFLMLQRYPEPEHFRLRHYEWRRPACTFGYSQKIAFVRKELPDPDLDMTRRATGGGIVDHTEDWTFSLVIPRVHDLWDQPGPQVYRCIHLSITESLRQLGAKVCLQSKPPETPAGICFARAEINDLLFQGSIWKPLLPGFDWEAFTDVFAQRLAEDTGVESEYPGWPEFDPDEETALIEQYASPEWIEAR